MPRIFLLIGGIFNTLLAVFHLTFWKAFDWPSQLALLAAENRAIMQVLNIHVAYTAGLFAVVSIVFRREMLDTRIGRFVTAAIAGFYILRALNQLIFWGQSTESLVAFFILLVIALLYDIPLHLTKFAHR